MSTTHDRPAATCPRIIDEVGALQGRTIGETCGATLIAPEPAGQPGDDCYYCETCGAGVNPAAVTPAHPTFTATRTYLPRGDGRGRRMAIITVTADDGTEVNKATLSGARAARAAVVLVVRARPEYGYEAAGCRQDAADGEREAHNLATATEVRGRHGAVPVTPFLFAAAVPVVDA